MRCTKCQYDGKLSRTKRAGFFEEHIYTLFGYFPWLCSACKRRFLLKDRGERRHTHRDHESGSMPIARQNEDGLHQSSKIPVKAIPTHRL